MDKRYLIYFVYLDQNLKQLCEGNTLLLVKDGSEFSLDHCQTELIKAYKDKSQTTEAAYAVIRNMTLL